MSGDELAKKLREYDSNFIHSSMYVQRVGVRDRVLASRMWVPKHRFIKKKISVACVSAKAEQTLCETLANGKHLPNLELPNKETSFKN